MNRHSPTPEILAPAGTLEAFMAALASGANAVYLGVAEGFHARARSTEFTLDTLPDLVRQARAAGTKVYLTLNTLVFEHELAELERMLRGALRAGVDALIVQDPAAALLARRLSKNVRLHASTQMTISSAEGASFAQTLGIDRVVLPRELSTAEIALFTKHSPLEAEVFVHGALCMAWSGQCLTSEAFSERSANRGQCSQACRMPYEAIIDGQKRELGDLRYLLSPEDLAAYDALPELIQAGVASLKIEGRYKGPGYVTMAVDAWRNWRDALVRGVTDADRERLHRDSERARLTFSRGGAIGFMAGDDHQNLVAALTPKHRGLQVGSVLSIQEPRVRVQLGSDPYLKESLRPGVGLKFELLGRSDVEHDPENAPGGPLFAVQFSNAGVVELSFGRPGPDLNRVRPGDEVRLTSDPEIARVVAQRVNRGAEGRLLLVLTARGQAGTPLHIQAEATLGDGRVITAQATTAQQLQVARGDADLEEVLREKLGALGGTPFRLAHLSAEQLDARLFLPVSDLKQLRRDIICQLDQQLAAAPYSAPPPNPALPNLEAELREGIAPAPGTPRLVPLCRTEEQLEAVIAAGVAEGDEVELDWMEMVGLAKAVHRARDAGLKVTLVTVRVQKQGEEAYDRRIAKLEPDGVLVRHWGALMHFAQLETRAGGLELHGDFSLNVTNSITANHLYALGLRTITASHDLNEAQLLSLLRNVPRGRAAVTLHHHIATFHNSHCVYAHLLSDGKDYKSCGRPCEEHRIALRDYAGHEHPVVVDVGCRNTMFNATAQSAAPLVPQLLHLGVNRFRVELVWESAAEVTRLLSAYRALLAGTSTPATTLETVGVHERYGVTNLVRSKRRERRAE